MTKSIALLSGGQDSTTVLYWAKERFDEVVAVSFDYGQRHVAELEAAKEIAVRAGVGRHAILNAQFLSDIGGSALVDKSKELSASGGYSDAEMPEGLPTSFVPGRNLLFLSMAAAVAVREGASDLVTGVCQTDYSGYPDCRREFVDSVEQTLNRAMPSSCGSFTIHTPLMHMTKAETVKLARELPGCWDALALSVTCYNGKRPGCGQCPACELRAKGFEEAGETDPAR